MSDYEELESFMSPLNVICTIPDGDSLITSFFLIYNFWPIALGFLILGRTITKFNFILLLLTCTNFIDNGFNYMLRTAVGPSNNIQTALCPTNIAQMPALGSQRIAVLYTITWFLATFTYPYKLKKFVVLMINFCAVLALFTRMYLGFSSPLQMFVGCLVGIGEGFVLSIFFFFLRIHEYDSTIIHFLQKWYVDVTDNFITRDDFVDDRESYGGSFTNSHEEPKDMSVPCTCTCIIHKHSS